MNKMKIVCLFFTVVALFFSSCGTDSDEYPRNMDGYQAALDHCKDALKAVAGKEEFDEWEFTVLETDEKNAFCYPEEKKIVVFSGLIDDMNNEAELASVVGHEFAHVIEYHGYKSAGVSILRSVGSMLLSAVSPTSGLVFDAGAELGVELPYNRSLESDADALGLLLMARAGYDPSASYTFWERQINNGGELGYFSSFFSDHPCDADRIEAMKKDEASAREEYDKAPVKYGFGKKFSDKK